MATPGTGSFDFWRGTRPVVTAGIGSGGYDPWRGGRPFRVLIQAGGAVPPAPGVPVTTIDAGAWTVTGAGSLHAALADDDPNSYAQSPANPDNAILKLGLTEGILLGAEDVVIEVDVEVAP